MASLVRGMGTGVHPGKTRALEGGVLYRPSDFQLMSHPNFKAIVTKTSRFQPPSIAISNSEIAIGFSQNFPSRFQPKNRASFFQKGLHRAIGIYPFQGHNSVREDAHSALVVSFHSFVIHRASQLVTGSCYW